MIKRLFKIVFLSVHSQKLYESISWFASFLIIAIAARLETMHHFQMLGNIDQLINSKEIIRGFASDVISALVYTIFCIYILRLRLLSLLMGIIWCYLTVGNYDHILVKNVNVSVALLHEALQPTFIYGSALSPRILNNCAIAISLFITSLIIFSVLLYLFSRVRWLFQYAVILPVAALVMATTTYAIVFKPDERKWQSYHMLEHNFFEFSGTPQVIEQVDHATLQQYVHVDMNGQPEYKGTPPKKPNILFIVIEGLSADMFDRDWLPYLRKRMPEALYYDNFIVSSDRTVNGMYSLLCGSYPLFMYPITANPSSISKTHDMPEHSYCLPQMLRNMGYKTIYIQPTDLFFDYQMMLARRSGFEYMYDYKSFQKPYSTNGDWGPDDKAYFKRILREIREQSTQDKPWFITALSIGTHHPSTIPKGMFPKLHPQVASNRYMDLQMENFLNALNKEGVLKNTLVVITSDESLFYNRLDPKFLRYNHGFLTILTPDKQHATIKEAFMQADLFVSIADYLNASTKDIALGRSVFRHYESFRPIFFGTIYDNRTQGLFTPDHIISCSKPDYKHCKKFHVDDDSLFYNEISEVPLNADDAYKFLSVARTIHFNMPVKPYLEPSASKNLHKGN